MIDSSKFAFADARVRTLEGKLLNKNKIDRIINADKNEEALRVLAESGYKNNQGQSSDNPYYYEEILNKELKDLNKLMSDICPIKEAIYIFKSEYDYFNIKVLMKAKYLNKDLSYLLMDAGNIELDKLVKYFNDEQFSMLSSYMSNAIKRILEESNSKIDPQMIDIYLDNALYEEMFDVVSKADNKFLTNLVKVLIDTINIKTFSRIKSQGKQRDFLEKAIIKNGSIRPEIYLRSNQDSIENFPERITFTGYSLKVKEGIESYLKLNNFILLEKNLDNIIIKYIRDNRFVGLGIEPVIGYYFSKKNEIKVVRTILVGKFNNISPEKIYERLGDMYV
ncbi:MAG: V-type ATP synthase subunit C [Clostridiaceae bacterium]